MTSFATIFAGAAALPSLALALDQPISAKLLTVKSTPRGLEVVFVSADPAVPFPAMRSSDDPSAGPFRMFIEFFSTSLWSFAASGIRRARHA